MKCIWLFFACLILLACHHQDLAENKGILRKALPDSADMFYASVEWMMNDYYDVKKNFVFKNDSLIIKAAAKLLTQTDSLPMKLLQGDSILVNNAFILKESFTAELKGLIEEKDIAEMKRDFDSITEQILDFLKLIQYKRTVVWYFYCNQTFNNAGAGWLDSTKTAVNPYDPDNGAPCGMLKDSIGVSP